MRKGSYWMFSTFAIIFTTLLFFVAADNVWNMINQGGRRTLFPIISTVSSMKFSTTRSIVSQKHQQQRASYSFSLFVTQQRKRKQWLSSICHHRKQRYFLFLSVRQNIRSMTAVSTIRHGENMLINWMTSSSVPLSKNVDTNRRIEHTHDQNSGSLIHTKNQEVDNYDEIDWNDTRIRTTNFCTHFIVNLQSIDIRFGDDELVGSSSSSQSTAALSVVVESVLHQIRLLGIYQITELTSTQLIELGSVWFINRDAPKGIPADGGAKPIRVMDPNFLVRDGDYLRIHHNPRRFLDVYKYDWSSYYIQDTHGKNENISLLKTLDPNVDDIVPGVLVATNDEKGWLVLNKPAIVPVHMTVDNAHENVASFMYQARLQLTKNTIGEEDRNDCGGVATNCVNINDNAGSLLYISTPQRLDQNTSGLLVIATSKLFAQYYSKLLSNKTKLQLFQRQQDDKSTKDHITKSSLNFVGGIHKVYRCLVCCIQPNEDNGRIDDINNIGIMDELQPNSTWSVDRAAATLQWYVRTGQIVKHYLEPSIRAPKRFVKEISNSKNDAVEEGDTFSSQSTIKQQQEQQQQQSNWAECLLRITKASPVYPLIGNRVAEELASELWSTPRIEKGTTTKNDSMQQDACVGWVEKPPKNCQAVVEVEIELLTGRTHQIRGQLSALGYPLVGDALYGGVFHSSGDENNKNNMCASSSNFVEHRLALQCCQLNFLDPDIVPLTNERKRKRKRNYSRSDNEDASSFDKNDSSNLYSDRDKQECEDIEHTMTVSQRWNEFRLDEAWWTKLLRNYNENIKYLNEEEMTIATKTQEHDRCDHRNVTIQNMVTRDASPEFGNTSSEMFNNYDTPKGKTRSLLLPPRVQLSPGKNKYVLIRAQHPDDDEVVWFVKSAAPEECGGPYHGNVAQDLREWIEALGYKVTVTGGGRIDYRPTDQIAVVYGFSYGFGKGDHALASSLIFQWSEGRIYSSYDNSEGLY